MYYALKLSVYTETVFTHSVFQHMGIGESLPVKDFISAAVIDAV